MIRFSHEANSWQWKPDHDFDAWQNISAYQARDLAYKGAEILI